MTSEILPGGQRSSAYLRNKAWRAKNRDRMREIRKAWRDANREKVRASQAAYQAANLEKMRALYKTWRARNKDKQAAGRKEREAAKLQATPPWFCKRSAEAVYFAASVTGAHVDHIVPLRGKNVCGLHWHHNLQLLTPEENLRKNAKFDPDTYVHELPEECK